MFIEVPNPVFFEVCFNICKQMDDWKIWNYNLPGAFNPGEQNAHLPNHWS